MKKCEICGQMFTPKSSRVRTCSKSCGGKLSSTQQAKEKAKRTKFARYGDENYNNRDKVKQTVKERYGEQYSNPAEVPEVKKKIADTYKQRHDGLGMASKQVSEKVLNAAKEKYGDDSITNVAQIPEIKAKIKASQELKYGGLGFASEELKAKAKNTYKEKYGEEMYSSLIRTQRRIESFIEKYGETSPAKVPHIKEKLINNYIKNHGGMGNARTSAISEKSDTLIEFEKLYNSNKYTIYEIADLLNKSLGTVRNYAKELGYEINLPNKLNETG